MTALRSRCRRLRHRERDEREHLRVGGIVLGADGKGRSKCARGRETRDLRILPAERLIAAAVAVALEAVEQPLALPRFVNHVGLDDPLIPIPVDQLQESTLPGCGNKGAFNHTLIIGASHTVDHPRLRVIGRSRMRAEGASRSRLMARADVVTARRSPDCSHPANNSPVLPHYFATITFSVSLTFSCRA